MALNSLHGVKLAHMVEALVEYWGWDQLALRIPVRCFMYDPSVKSALKFLRKTPWARTKVEEHVFSMCKILMRNEIH